MAVSELFACDSCPFDVVLIHAEEWATVAGVPQAYTGRGSIGGLWNRLWCPVCRAARHHIFVQLDPPADHAVVAFAEAQRRGATGRETGPCPVCETALVWQVDGTPCPRCPEGRLHFTGEWEDAV